MIRRILVRPASPLAAAALAVLLCVPSLPHAGDLAAAPLRDEPTSSARIRAAVLYQRTEFFSFAPAISRGHETVGQRLPLHRQVDDEWIAIDKAKHLVVSFLWTLGTQYVAVNKGGLSEYSALPLSITSSAAAGVTKEYYDLRVGPTRFFSMRDIVADAVGILLATGVILF